MMPFLQNALLLIASIALSTGVEASNHVKKGSKGKARHTRKAEAPTPTGTPYGRRADVMQMAQDIALRRNLDPAWVSQTLAQAQAIPVIARLMLPPPSGTPKNWRVYRSRFVEPVRIAAGVRFWQAQRDWLQRAEQAYGVPAEIIVGIIGVETIYGQQMGTYRVIDALATLAFDFPKAHPRAEARQAFFMGELEQYLSLASRRDADPLQARGSYAGAMGMPQFMPSSWAKYAVDFDGDGKVDLFNSPADVIGSVASYFQAFNWQPGMPTHYPVRFDPARLDLDALLAPDILPTFSVASMAAKGALVEPRPEDPDKAPAGTLALVELQNGNEPAQYVAGTENFYAITRYNWSNYYAMAVIELGQAVAKQMGERR